MWCSWFPCSYNNYYYRWQKSYHSLLGIQKKFFAACLWVWFIGEIIWITPNTGSEHIRYTTVLHLLACSWNLISTFWSWDTNICNNLCWRLKSSLLDWYLKFVSLTLKVMGSFICWFLRWFPSIALHILTAQNFTPN